ncbi:RNA-binding protein, putative [Plasmodium relictum]|uniref:RNA-binding protein, putative n=1 Tax=Plasmodium relictum TaxID=85471 RepID=A0A1J1HBR1_PLARL|nr:RNA-binding protein, putative [Plasmodium relictum]CRH02526.1 RNA-binding protein, putative [Plasmodium relictum]
MIFLKSFLMLGFAIFNVSSFIKHRPTFSNYIGNKTDKYKKKKRKICSLLSKNKDDEVESYIPYIYKDIAPSLKDLADEEYSYKELLNAYFPETIEREKRIKEEKKKLKEQNGKKQNIYEDLDTILNNTEKDIEEKLTENNIENFEHISKIKDGKAKNKILDNAYDIIESSLKKVYFSKKKEDDNKTNYLELAKKEKDLLYNKLINGYSMVNNSSTFDFFGVFYDSEDYKNEKKILLEMDKILNLEPFKSNQGDILQDIDSILKKNKIPASIRNFLIKYKHIGKKIYNMKKSENYKNKMECQTNELNYDNNQTNKQKEIEKENGYKLREDNKKDNSEDIEKNEESEENIKNNAVESSKKIINKEEKEEESMYKEFSKDLNKVIMTIHNNLNNEELIKKDCFYLDELYEAYKKHFKQMHIKRNILEPQRNNYDFLTFIHEHFEEYFFSKYGNFDYEFNERVRKIKKAIKDKKNIDNLQNKERFNKNENSQNEKNINNSNSDKILNKMGEITQHLDNSNSCSNNSDEKHIYNKINNYKDDSILEELKTNKKLKKYILIDIIKNYNKKIYDIYKPNDIITNVYGFSNYIDNEKHDKEIDLTFNKHSILNYDSKEVSNIDERLYVGKLVFGKIFRVEKNIAYVDINHAFYAEIHVDQMPYNIDNIEHVFKVNDKLIFEIYKMYTDKILLTLKNIQKINDLNKILLYKTKEIPFDVHVNSILKNGISASYNDIQTFIHISSISSKYKVKVEDEEKILDTLVNQKIKVYCTDIHKLSFSNILYEQNQQLKNINIYDAVEVDIIHISKYGLMVKYCDIVGLIHISEISKKKILNLSSIFKINDKIKGVIINIDYDNKRFSLSTKILESEGRNIIDHKMEIYDDIINIVNNIKKRNFSSKINDANIKNQLLSLIDIYKNDDSKEKKQVNDIIPEKINKDDEIYKSEEIYQNNKVNENEHTKYNNENNQLKDDNNDNNLKKEKIKDDTNSITNEKEQEEKELSIDIHNQMIPYLMIKQEESNKIEEPEEKKEIIWNLEDENFLSSNSPSQSSQFYEYQWSYFKEKKWINFTYYINRIMNYYFNINDDFFTYKEKNTIYEIDFVKSIRIDLSTGLYTKIRKTIIK